MRRTDEQIAIDCEALTQIASLDLIWLAGLFEGEGAFFVQRFKRTVMPIVAILMTDKDIVDRVASLLRHRCLGPYINKATPTNKPHFSVTLAGRKALKFCDLMYDLLGTRRRIEIDTLRHAYATRPTPRKPQSRRKE